MTTDFDAKARTWDADPAKAERARTVAEAIRAALPLTSSTSVLEYGCGTGLLGFALQPFVGDVTLVDSSREMLRVVEEKIASSRVRNVRSLHLDLVTDPVPELRFDLVCTLLTLHHVKDVAALLRRFRVLTRPSGHLCVSDLDLEDGSFHGAGFDGHNGFDRADLTRRLQAAGFDDVRIDTACEVTKGSGAGSRVYSVFLAIAAAR